ncbi:MAG: hypothetical protein JNM59_05380 [Hyphomonadaceae bacterium]|nr:hypothetical protein [Hyphomonadaceae bacterium]
MRIGSALIGLAAALCAAPESVAQVTETCGIFVRQGAEQVSYIPTPGYYVTNAATPLQRPPEQAQVDGVICDRLSLILMPNDYRVLTDLSVPFYVRSGIRLVALEIGQGQLQVRFLRGEPTEEERLQIAAAIDVAQDALIADRAGDANN